jgi:hypothetical protein
MYGVVMYGRRWWLRLLPMLSILLSTLVLSKRKSTPVEFVRRIHSQLDAPDEIHSIGCGLGRLQSGIGTWAVYFYESGIIINYESG